MCVYRKATGPFSPYQRVSFGKEKGETTGSRLGGDPLGKGRQTGQERLRWTTLSWMLPCPCPLAFSNLECSEHLQPEWGTRWLTLPAVLKIRWRFCPPSPPSQCSEITLTTPQTDKIYRTVTWVIPGWGRLRGRFFFMKEFHFLWPYRDTAQRANSCAGFNSLGEMFRRVLTTQCSNFYANLCLWGKCNWPNHLVLMAYVATPVGCEEGLEETSICSAFVSASVLKVKDCLEMRSCHLFLMGLQNKDFGGRGGGRKSQHIHDSWNIKAGCWCRIQRNHN